MKHISLTKNKSTIVDDCDYIYLMQWKWYVTKYGRYAVRNARHADTIETGKMIYLHDVIATRKGLKSKIDHTNRNSLDNRRNNLREATNAQNLANRGPQRNNTTGYKGVVYDQQRDRWIAQIKVNQKHIFLGRFGIKLEVARAYNKGAKKYFGKFAYLNPL